MAKCKTCTEFGSVFIVSCTTNAMGEHHSYNDNPSVVLKNFYQGETRLDKYWHKNEVPHRLDGPAAIWGINTMRWYLQGKMAVAIRNQVISIASPIRIDEDVATVLRHVEGCFYEALLGNKKVLVARV